MTWLTHKEGTGPKKKNNKKKKNANKNKDISANENNASKDDNEEDVNEPDSPVDEVPWNILFLGAW